MLILVSIIKKKQVLMNMNNESAYKLAGVDIEAGDEFVRRIKNHVKSTFSKNVLADIGLFGSFYEFDLSKYKKPILVSSVDGVGTKLKIAFMMDKHDTIGQDLVNHCVNDIAVCGAEPLYFLDYLAFGKLIPERAEKIVEGLAKACRENNCSFVGGETAEMPGFYAENEYDIAGMIVGAVEKDKIINGSNTSKGDILIGFESNGLHTNGYSLARKVIFSKFSPFDKIDDFELTIGEELLKIHKSYLNLINILKENITIKAFSHITGGGIIGNTIRVTPQNLSLKIDWNSWKPPYIFKFIQKLGNISDDEMRKVFNLGIGLIAIVDKNFADETIKLANQINEKAYVIGEVV